MLYDPSLLRFLDHKQLFYISLFFFKPKSFSLPCLFSANIFLYYSENRRHTKQDSYKLISPCLLPSSIYILGPVFPSITMGHISLLSKINPFTCAPCPNLSQFTQGLCHSSSHFFSYNHQFVFSYWIINHHTNILLILPT